MFQPGTEARTLWSPSTREPPPTCRRHSWSSHRTSCSHFRCLKPSRHRHLHQRYQNRCSRYLRWAKIGHSHHIFIKLIITVNSLLITMCDSVTHGRKSWGGGTILKVGDIISNVPPPPLFLGWMIINWNEDPFYMFSDVVDHFFFLFFFCLSERFVMYDGHLICATFEGGGPFFFFFFFFFFACHRGL